MLHVMKKMIHHLFHVPYWPHWNVGISAPFQTLERSVFSVYRQSHGHEDERCRPRH